MKNPPPNTTPARDLTLVSALSLLVALLVAAASLAGLFFQSALYPNEELRRSFVPNDLVNLLIGLPILLGSLVLARRGSLLGLLFWPGALLFVFYNYAAYAFAVRWTLPSLLYLVLALLSAGTALLLLALIDREAVGRRLAGAVPARLAGGVLAGFGLLFFAWRGVLVVQAFAGPALVAGPELAVALADLLITPLWIVSGVSLWRRRAFGYVTGAGLLFQASMLFVGLLVFFVLQPFLAAVPFPVEDFVVILVMGMVCFIPFGLFVRGVLSRQRMV